MASFSEKLKRIFVFTVCRVEWETPIHDGPVKMMHRSPHSSNLVLTVGGYSWAVWAEGAAVYRFLALMHGTMICQYECLIVIRSGTQTHIELRTVEKQNCYSGQSNCVPLRGG